MNADSVLSATTFDALEHEALGCRRCPLAETRNQVVFGAGDPHADLVFVGEGPGAEEDKTGIPFVGRAGRLLTTLIEGIGLTREQTYIANVVKCRPPGNRDPLPLEIETCRPFLDGSARFHRPTGHRHARQLRDQAPARHEGRDHEAARLGVPPWRRGRRRPDVASVGGVADRWRASRQRPRRLRADEACARAGPDRAG